MSHLKYVEVKETKQQLKSLQRNCIPLIYPRIQMLLCMKRHFKTKIKVSRKSHVKKDEQAVEVFKKTLVGTV